MLTKMRTTRRAGALFAGLALLLVATAVATADEMPWEAAADEASTGFEEASEGLGTAEEARANDEDDGSDDGSEVAVEEGDVTDALQAADNVQAAADLLRQKAEANPDNAGLAIAADNVQAAADTVLANVQAAIARAQAGQAGEGDDEVEEEFEEEGEDGQGPPEGFGPPAGVPTGRP